MFFRKIQGILRLSLLSIFSLPLSFADIDTPNVGEKAMIAALRASLDRLACPNASKVNIGAGTSGCKGLSNSHNSSDINVLLTWKMLEDMKTLPKDTIVVLPKHAISDHPDENVKYHAIHGVLHERSQQSVQKENANKVSSKTKMIIMLAGDTQQDDGSMSLYTTDMVASFIAELPQDQDILILNGPRTGKYKTSGSDIIIDDQAHRTGIDDVTQKAIASSNDSWIVEDFVYGTPSLWGPALKFCMDNPETILVLPGESTSMISEALSLGIAPAIHEHSAMTPSSFKYVDQLVHEGRVTRYPQLPELDHANRTPIEPQQDVVAKMLCHLK